MEIKRDDYLNKLIAKKHNGLIKVITGMRRCGKSYLLFQIFHQYLLSSGVDESHIIELSLEDDTSIEYRNPISLGKYIRSRITDDKMYYVIVCERGRLDMGKFKDTCKRIKEYFDSLNVNTISCETLEEAFLEAVKNSKENDTILLSPACASWDQYESFEVRGEEFKKIVEELDK